MNTITTTATVSLTEPSILTANTYFWTAAGNASSRRRNEERRQAEVATYLETLGFSITRNGDLVIGEMMTTKGAVVIRFAYNESCKNVYKSLDITRDGKKSNISTLRKIAAEVEGRELTPAQVANREGGEDYYKAVALVNGKMLSIFDGETEYQIGVEIKERARQEHSGGIYVYRTLAEAQSATVPNSSALLDTERVILRVRAEGQYCRYDNRKLAFSRVTPLEVVNGAA